MSDSLGSRVGAKAFVGLLRGDSKVKPSMLGRLPVDFFKLLCIFSRFAYTFHALLALIQSHLFMVHACVYTN